MVKHFYPKKGWMNDPNGLIVIDGTYHMFFQYYPGDIVWGPMHWGHAVSKNGIDWEELPVAIWPDENEYIFSGSAIYDRDNRSGLGTDEAPALLCFYTGHNPKTKEQQQCLAYSTDFVRFVKYSQNPLITNRRELPGYRADFRDPKVYWIPDMERYGMCLAGGEEICFYQSDNLLDWKFIGTLDILQGLGHGITECPDCFQIGDKWFLSLSFIPHCDTTDETTGFMDRHVMYYTPGHLDGGIFVPDDAGRWFPLDYGPDHYAAVTFADSPVPIMVGWGENWDYVTSLAAGQHRGKMTGLRQLDFVKKGESIRLRQIPLGPSEEIVLAAGTCTSLSKDGSVTVSVTDEEISVGRHLQAKCAESEGGRLLELAGYQQFTAKRLNKGLCRLQYTEDDGYLEVFAEDGCICFSLNY